MDSKLCFDRALPVLPITCGVYDTSLKCKIDIPALEYHKSIFKYAHQYTDDQVLLAYPKHMDDKENILCDVYRLGTAIAMEACEPIVIGEKLKSHSIKTSDTVKVKIECFSFSDEGVRLAHCEPFKERPLKLNFEQTMNFLLPIWVSIRANSGAMDSISCALPNFGNISFIEYMDDIDVCLDKVCRYLPLGFKEKAAFFAAENVVGRAMLALAFLNKFHSSGAKIDVHYADSKILNKWNKFSKFNAN